MGLFEENLFSYFDNMKHYMRSIPMNLGGVTASGGGVGGPPGGFIGYLPQGRIAYDLSELATDVIPVSGSLLDNLNHIRHRIQVIEEASSGTLSVYEDGIFVASGITVLDFIGASLDVTGTTAEITISGGSTGGGHVIQDEGTPVAQRTNLNFVGASVTVVDDDLNDATKIQISVTSSGGITDHTELDNLNSSSYYHLTQANHTDLTDSGDSTLHYHANDRARGNHTGYQQAATISGFDNAVSNNSDVLANTSARHTTHTESSLTLSAVTTNDVSITKHGFMPVLPNDATKFINGVGSWVTVSGGTGDSGHTILDGNNTELAQRTKLKFTGAVSVSDDSANDTTIVSISGLYNPIEDLSDSCDGLETQFSTTYEFTENSTLVWLNGILQREGTGYAYEEDAGLASITFSEAPLTNDELIISYSRYSSAGGGSSSIVIPSGIWIATTGSDTTGSGTSGSPYATIEKALSILPDILDSPCTIYVADGTYAEPIEIERFSNVQSNILTISGNTTTPSNVTFTGVATSNACCAIISGNVWVKLEGIRVNVTSTRGIYVKDRASLIITECISTGTISWSALECSKFSYLELLGDNTLSGFSGVGLSIIYQSIGLFSEAGTLTITGPGTSGTGVQVYQQSLFKVSGESGLNITITGIKYGFSTTLSSIFHHIQDTGTITVDNASKPSQSAAVFCTDVSSWSTSQAVVIDNFTSAFEANSICYIEAVGSRTITNCTGTSSASQNSVIYLP